MRHVKSTPRLYRRQSSSLYNCISLSSFDIYIYIIYLSPQALVYSLDIPFIYIVYIFKYIYISLFSLVLPDEIINRVKGKRKTILYVIIVKQKNSVFKGNVNQHFFFLIFVFPHWCSHYNHVQAYKSKKQKGNYLNSKCIQAQKKNIRTGRKRKYMITCLGLNDSIQTSIIYFHRRKRSVVIDPEGSNRKGNFFY